MTHEERLAALEWVERTHAKIMGDQRRRREQRDIEAECARLGIINARRRPDGVWEMAQE